MNDANGLWQGMPQEAPNQFETKTAEVANNQLAIRNRFLKPRQFQQPRYKTICKRVRVINPLNKRGIPQQLGDVVYELDGLGDIDQSSVGASIGLSANGANASVGFSWGKIAMIAIPVAYLTWTMVLKKKGLGLPIVG